MEKMNKKLAKRLEKTILSNSRGFQKPIWDFCKGQGYLALGFDTLKEWAKTKESDLGCKYDSLNNYYHTARITVFMCGEDKIGSFSPHALLQMKKLTEEQCLELYEHAQAELDEDELDSSHLTNANVSTYMDELDFFETKVPSDDDESDDEDDEDEENKFFNSIKSNQEEDFALRVSGAIHDSLDTESLLIICKTLMKKCKRKRLRSAIKVIDGLLENIN
jgi:hypothetical protein